MATYAAKTGTQNFTDTWALVDATSANFANPTVNTTGVAITASYVNSSNWTYASSAPTIDGIGLGLYCTALQNTTFESLTDRITGTFSVSLYNVTDATEVAVVTCDVKDLAPGTFNTQANWLGGEYTTRARVQWVFFKFSSAVTLATGKNYCVRLRGSVANEVYVHQVNGSNWMRYLRTTNTSASPTTGDRLFICGEVTGQGTYSSVTVNHDQTATTSYGKLEVGAFGSWIWGTNASTNYYFKTSDDIRICTYGTLQIGDPNGTTMPSTSTATIEFVCTSANSNILMMERKSTVTIGGQYKNHIAYLQSNVTTSNNSATVSLNKIGATVDPGWKANDEVIFAPFAPDSGNHWNKFDSRFLTADSSAGSITLSTTAGGPAANFTYAHDTRVPYVANLTRNIKVVGTSAANTCSFEINGDKFNIQNVELKFTDGFKVRNGDYAEIGTIKNCVAKDGRNNTLAVGFLLQSCKNVYVQDCVVSRSSGFYVNVVGPNNATVPPGTGSNPSVTNCVAIGNSFNQPFASDGEGMFTDCVGAGNNGLVFFSLGSRSFSMTVAKNCWFGMANSTGQVWGVGSGYGGWGGNYIQTNGCTDPVITLDSCTFYGNTVDCVQQGIVFQNCIFQRPYATTYGWFLSFNSNIGSNRARLIGNVYFNNCSFSLDTPGGTNNLFNHDGQNARAIFNNCSINSAWANIQAYNQEFIFNNLTSSYITFYKKYSNVGTAFNPTNLMNGILVADNSKIVLVNHNGATNENCTFTASGGFVADADIYDSSPRSLRIWSNKSNSGFLGPKIKIPLKANQGATVTMKMRLSEHSIAEGTFLDNNRSFIGMIPSLVIQPNYSSGANYSSRQEIFPGDITALNGTPSVSNFDPTSLGSNCKLWLNGDNISNFTYDSYNRVSQWSDSSGNSNHLTQSTNAKKPLFAPTERVYDNIYKINGKYGVRMRGAKDERLAIGSNILGTSTAENEVFIVVMPVTGQTFESTTYQRIGGVFGYDINHYGSLSPSNGSGNQHGMAVYKNSTLVSGATNLFNEHLFLTHFRNSVANSQNDLRTNNYLDARVTSNLPNLTPSQFAIGTHVESTGTLNRYSSACFIYEVVVVNRRMTSTEVDNMSKYLANKHKIALRQRYTSFQTVSYTIPAVTNDTVVEANICLRGSWNYGWVNIDTITVT